MGMSVELDEVVGFLFLKNAPDGTVVRDRVGDRWVKNHNGNWDCRASGVGTNYQNWTSERLSEVYSGALRFVSLPVQGLTLPSDTTDLISKHTLLDVLNAEIETSDRDSIAGAARRNLCRELISSLDLIPKKKLVVTLELEIDADRVGDSVSSATAGRFILESTLSIVDMIKNVEVQ